jgi:hypothetical protein
MTTATLKGIFGPLPSEIAFQCFSMSGVRRAALSWALAWKGVKPIAQGSIKRAIQFISHLTRIIFKRLICCFG